MRFTSIARPEEFLVTRAHVIDSEGGTVFLGSKADRDSRA